MNPRPSWGHRWVAFVGTVFLWIVDKTSFVQKIDHPCYIRIRREKGAAIYSFWHNIQVMMALSHRGRHVTALVSQSKDGEYIAQIMKNLGHDPVRGSTSHGGVQALKSIVKLLKQGKQVGFTPDGPRGPVGTVHDGVIGSAVLSGVPILPCAISSRRKIVFNSWDHFQLPLPFGHNTISHGQPFRISRNQDVQTSKDQLRSILNQLTDDVAKIDQICPSWFGCLFEIMCLWLYRCLSFAVLPVIFPVLSYSYGLRRTLVGLAERLFFEFDLKAFKGCDHRLWFHAASVGEWQALKPLITRFLHERSTGILITTSTFEARNLVRQEQPSCLVSLMPIDIFPVIVSWLKKIRPTAVILTETELWPNLIHECSTKEVPVFVINGRLSDKSTRRWAWMRPLMSSMLRKLCYIYARSEADAANFVSLGAFPFLTQAVGNMKSDNLVVLGEADRLRLRKQLFGLSPDSSILVGGSTWPGEEEILLKVLSSPECSSWKLILAPRRPERFKDIRDLLSQQSSSWSLWSDVKKTQNWTTRVLLVDTLGDLKKIYGAGTIAFIGGSVYPRGGQNPLEALASGNSVVFGPHMENFKSEASLAVSCGSAVQGQSGQHVAELLKNLLMSPERLKKMGQLASETVQRSQGASDRIFKSLQESLLLC